MLGQVSGERLWSAAKRGTLAAGGVMTAPEPKVMSWWMIIAILALTICGVGMLLGALGQAFDVAPGRMTAGVGAAGGVVGALLVTRRRAALALAKRRAG